MLPLSLTIEGLYSYRNKQTIDFERLYEDGIFGIFGPVGSGKSAILDAIMLSLYGSVDRLSLRERRNYNLLNLGSSKLEVVFTFAHNAKTYQFTVNARRHSKKFDTVEDFEHRAYERHGDEWIPIPLLKRSISKITEDILGLTYQNFNRTIIIPQGKFQEFLKLSPSDRTAMLCELFNFDKYDLHKASNAKRQEVENEVTALKGQLESLSAYTKEARKACEDEISELDKAIATEKGNLDILQKRITEFRAQKKLVEERQSLQADWERLNKTKAAEEKIKTELALHTHCRADYASDLSMLVHLREDQERKKRDLKDGEAKQKKIALEIDSEKEELTQITEQLKHEDEIEAELKELKILAEICGGRILIEERKKEQQQAQSTLARTKAEAEAKGKEIKAKQEALDRLEKSLVKADVLQAIRQWYSQWVKLNEQWQALEELRSAREKSHTAQQEKHEEEIRKELDKVFPNKHAEFRTFEMLQRNVEEAVAKLTKNYDKQRLLSEIEKEHRCPICESSISQDKIEELRKKRQEGIGAHLAEPKKVLELLEKVHKSVAQYAAREKMYNNEQERCEAELVSKHKELERQKESFRWSEEPVSIEEAQTQEFYDRQYELQEKLTNLKQEMGDLNGALSALTTLTHEYTTETLPTIEKHLAPLQETETQLVGKLQKFRARAMEPLKSECIEKMTTDRRNSLTEWRNEKGNLLTRIGTLQAREETLHDHLSEQRVELSASAEKISKLEEKLNINLARDRKLSELLRQLKGVGGEMIGLDILRKMVNQQVEKEWNVQELQKANDNFFNELNEKALYLKENERQMAGKVYNPEEHESEEAALNACEHKTIELNEKKGRLMQKKEAIEANVRKREDLEKMQTKLSTKLENLELLTKLFHGKAFVEYASQNYLQNLCALANKHFMRMVNNSLKINFEDGQFTITDHLNEGKTRSIKTLSGGQSFQAALSMAIALSDSIKANLGQEERSFFFLDEGFGSLDKESINVVINTLQKLREENRIIGLISHVEEIQEQLDFYITVRATEQDGSAINYSSVYSPSISG